MLTWIWERNIKYLLLKQNTIDSWTGINIHLKNCWWRVLEKSMKKYINSKRDVDNWIFHNK